ncbi:MAG: hypothetical protein EON88_16645, partial [Brevundimonas sp.]
MRLVAAIAAAVCALSAGLVVADAAEAQTAARRGPSVNLTEAAAAQDAGQQTQRRGMRLNPSGRWGLDFNLNQPVGRESNWGDVEAGAYYRLSPRLRVGAAAAVGSPETDPARAPETDRRSQSRFRLET